MRLRQRRNVLLPQPDGPMMAVTVLAGNSSEISRTATVRSNSAVSRCVARRAGASAGAIALPGGPAGRRGEEQDQSHEDQRRCPCQAVPLLERPGRVREDLQRERLHRMAERETEVQVAERGEQQRRRLTGALVAVARIAGE